MHLHARSKDWPGPTEDQVQGKECGPAGGRVQARLSECLCILRPRCPVKDLLDSGLVAFCCSMLAPVG